MFLCVPCTSFRVNSQWPHLTCYRSKLENWIPKVDLPEIKGNHRKFRNLVTSYIGNSVYVCVHLSICVRMYVCFHKVLCLYMYFFLWMICFSLILQYVDLQYVVYLTSYVHTILYWTDKIYHNFYLSQFFEEFE